MEKRFAGFFGAGVAADQRDSAVEDPFPGPGREAASASLPFDLTTVAHTLNLMGGEYRSDDVLLDGDDTDVDFREFGLSEEVVRGLVHEGFEKPSPIQLDAIPIGLTGQGKQAVM